MKPTHLLLSALLMSTSATSIAATAATPPDAARKPHTVKAPHGAQRNDEYYWLRDDKRESPEMLDYLKAENAYADAVMAPLNFELPYAGAANGNVEGRALTFGIRPEDLVVESGAPVEAKVHDVENHGVEKILTLRVGDAMLRATVPAQTHLAIEDAVRFSWNPEKVVLFDQKSGNSLKHAG